MKFQLLFRVCLIFYTYDSANFKSIGNNTMKKMLLASALACLLQDVLNRRLLFMPAVAPETITIISSFLELGRRKLSMQPKFVAAQKILLKQKPSKHS